ncbi:MAG: AarF/ABC1/UbiB kinase family protein [Methanospirillaceae archaeon]|nr:AarF/ABC1/UbiB kinase family protein [Methanospirillaceae archaeon]
MGTAELKRYHEIYEILLKYGFSAYLLEELSPGLAKMDLQSRFHPELHSYSLYERIRMAVEELGPTFVKFGQILSTRRELISPQFCQELEKLQDKVPPLPFEVLRPTIEMYCGPVDDAFLEFDTQPIAAASVSQVHRAVLPDGTPVAVKIQRPGIRDVIDLDLPILRRLAGRLERLDPNLALYNLTGLIDEFVTQIYKELNFVSDGQSADLLNENFRDNPVIKAPLIYWEYSGPLMLTMEFIEGVRIDRVEVIRSWGVDPKKIAEAGFQSYLQQIFVDGFFHSDPHPGNLMVTKEGVLVFIDFGMVSMVRPERQELMLRALLSIVDTDAVEFVNCLRKFGMKIPDTSVEEFTDQIYYAFVSSRSTRLHQLNFGSAMTGTMEKLQEYNVRFPSSLMQVLKVIWMVYDVAMLLDPGFNFNDRVKPYIKIIIEERYLTARSLKNIPRLLFDMTEGIAGVPKAINEVVKTLSSGSFRLDVVSDDVTRMTRSIQDSTDKLVAALLIASMVVGSSLVMNVPYIQDFEGIFWLALSLYLFAIFLAVLSYVRLFRH